MVETNSPTRRRDKSNGEVGDDDVDVADVADGDGVDGPDEGGDGDTGDDGDTGVDGERNGKPAIAFKYVLQFVQFKGKTVRRP